MGVVRGVGLMVAAVAAIGVVWAVAAVWGGRAGGTASTRASGGTESARAAGGGAGGAVSVESAIIQRDGDTLRLLNATLRPPGAGGGSVGVRQVDVAIRMMVDDQGKVGVESMVTPTMVVGVNALIAGNYSYGALTYELKGPALDVDMRPTWSIMGRAFSGNVVTGPVKGKFAQLKWPESLPEVGTYGLMYNYQAFPGFPNSSTCLVNIRQVGDTLVLTAYVEGNGRYEQSGVTVMKRAGQ